MDEEREDTEHQATRTPGNGRYVRTRQSAQRDAEALAHRSRGLSYRDIALTMGMASVSSAHASVQRALAATIPTEDAAAVRTLELDRLDTMQAAVMAVLERKHVTVSNGRIVYLDDEPLEDDAPVLAAVDRLLRIQERRSKLLGLDAEQKVNVSAGVRYEIVGIDPVEIIGE